MSNILALDTSTDACSVALSCNGEIKEDFRIIPRQHTQQLLPMIEAILADAGIAISALDAIAFGRGPGSFAGIRIATGVAQGLAYGADLPVLPISIPLTLSKSPIIPPAGTDLHSQNSLSQVPHPNRMDTQKWRTT